MDRDYRVSDELFNQAKITLKGFGLSKVKPLFYKVNTNNPTYELEEKARNDGKLNTNLNYFGLLTFDVLIFEGLSYDTRVIDKNGNATYSTITIPSISLGNVLIDVTMDKNIVMTQVQGRNGSIKEYISDGDYRITIKGILTENAIDYKPIEKIQSLIKFCKACVPITVTSNLLRDQFSITSLVIKSYNIPQTPDMRNVQKFELVCYSETPYEIKIKS